MLYCSSVCALSVLCDKLFTVARYACFEKSLWNCLHVVPTARALPTALRELAGGGETTNADVPESCSHVTDGGSTIGRWIAHHVVKREQRVIFCCTTSTDVCFPWRQEKSERRTQRCAQAQQSHRSQREGEHTTATDRHLGMFFPPSFIYSPKCVINRVVFFLLAVKLVKPIERFHVACLQPPDSTQRCCFPLTAIYPWALHTHTAFSFCSLHAWSPTRQWDSFQDCRHIAPAKCLFHLHSASYYSRPLMQSRWIKCLSVECVFDQSSCMCRCLYRFLQIVTVYMFRC